MEGLLVNVGIAVGAIVVANLVTRWWDRARPLVVLERFSTGLKMGDKATCTKEIHEFTKNSMAVQSVSEGEVEYRELEQAYVAAKRDMRLNDEIDKWVIDARSALSKATTDQDIVNGVRLMFKWTGLREYIEMLFYRSLIKAKPSFQYQGDPKLPVVPSEQYDGCYLIVLGDTMARVGGDLTNDKWRNQAIQVLVEALQHLDKNFLVSVLDEIPAIASAQRDVHRGLVDLIEPIREDNTIWIAHCTVVNYGSSPLIVWPTGKILLRPKGRSGTTEVLCHLAKQKRDDPSDANDLTGPFVLEPGATAFLWVVSSEKKAKLPDGNVISAYFKDATATGRARLSITQRGVPFKCSCKSTPLVFKEIE